MMTEKIKAKNLSDDGLVAFKQDNFKLAEQLWSDVTFEMDKIQYARAQYNLGCLYKKQGDLEATKKYWLSITKKISKIYYAVAQYNLGLMSKSQKNIDEAKIYWGNITVGDSKEYYSRAKLQLGLLEKGLNNYKSATQHWLAIKKNISEDKYAIAQYRLAVLKRSFLKKENEERKIIAIEEEIINHLDNICREINLKYYIKAQYLLGHIKLDGLSQRDQKNRSIVEKQVEKIWENILFEDDAEYYIKSQTFLGFLKYDQAYRSKKPRKKLLFSSEIFFQNVISKKRDIVPSFYEHALIGLGMLKHEGNDYEKMEEYWDKLVLSEQSHKIILEELIKTIFTAKDISNRKELINRYTRKADDKIKSFQVKIINNIINYEIEYLEKIFHSVDKIIQLLHLGNSQLQDYCGAFAHYTRYSTALKMLDKNSSLLRLSTTHFMNDPKEGMLINDLLGIAITEQYDNHKHLAFASCFSLNHNSLNQFRLYGKTDQKENSGVSLIFDKSFYQMDTEENSIIEPSVIQMTTKEVEIIGEPIEGSEVHIEGSEIHENIVDYIQDQEKIEIQKIGKQSLYCCIYIDPESKYLRMARRSKLSFYRSVETKQNAQDEYISYLNILDKMDEKINKILKKLKDDVMGVREYYLNKENSINNQNINIQQKKSRQQNLNNEQKSIWALVNDILLPLRYLIKHAAFEEEEECRMIYITDICDEKIQSDPEKKWLYVEYAEPVKDHIKKVYLGDGAKDYRPFFERALGNKSKVKDSNNPFRT